MLGLARYQREAAGAAPLVVGGDERSDARVDPSTRKRATMRAADTCDDFHESTSVRTLEATPSGVALWTASSILMASFGDNIPH